MCWQYWSALRAEKKKSPSFTIALHAFESRCEEIILRLNHETRLWGWLVKNWFWNLNTSGFGKPEEKIWRTESNTLPTQRATILVSTFCPLKQTSAKD